MPQLSGNEPILGLNKSTSGKEESIEPESFYTPYPESIYKYEERFELPEETKYIPLENIPILEEIQEEKPNLSFQVNILAAEKTC
jgi:hypothetical protein